MSEKTWVKTVGGSFVNLATADSITEFRDKKELPPGAIWRVGFHIRHGGYVTTLEGYEGINEWDKTKHDIEMLREIVKVRFFVYRVHINDTAHSDDRGGY